MNVVIIGYGVASYWALKTIRKYSPATMVKVITGEPYPAYYKVFLADYIAQKLPVSRMHPPDMIKPDEHFQLHMGKRVVKVDTDKKTVLLHTGEVLRYDKLLISSGVKTTLPDELKKITGIFTLNSITDAISIKSADLRKKNAVVIGDNINIFETVRALRAIDMKVTILSSNRRIFQKYIDEKASRLVLNLLGNVDFVPCAEIKSFVSENNILKGIETTAGTVVDADIAVINGPFQPNLEFMGLDSKIQADSKMCTKYPDVYTAGDVCRFEDEDPDFSFGWRRAWFQGITAGANIAGGDKTYFAVQSLRGETNGFPVIFIGAPVSSLENCELIEHIDLERKTLKQVYHKNKVVLSAVFIGSVDKICMIEELAQNKEVIYEPLSNYVKIESNGGSGRFREFVCPVCKSNLDITFGTKLGSKLNCPICAVELLYSSENNKPKISLALLNMKSDTV